MTRRRTSHDHEAIKKNMERRNRKKNPEKYLSDYNLGYIGTLAKLEGDNKTARKCESEFNRRQEKLYREIALLDRRAAWLRDLA